MANPFPVRRFIVIVSAPSGGGKSTVLSVLVPGVTDLKYSVSYTTRQPRGSEMHGRDYYFVSETEFTKMIDEGAFLEYARVHGNWYGTSKKVVGEMLAEDSHVIMDIDVQGAANILKSGLPAVAIFLLPPTGDVLEQRLRKRGTDSEDTIRLRLRNAGHEIRQVGGFHYLVINDELGTAVNDIRAIIRAEEIKIGNIDNIERIFYGRSDAQPQG